MSNWWNGTGERVWTRIWKVEAGEEAGFYYLLLDEMRMNCIDELLWWKWKRRALFISLPTFSFLKIPLKLAFFDSWRGLNGNFIKNDPYAPEKNRLWLLYGGILVIFRKKMTKIPSLSRYGPHWPITAPWRAVPARLGMLKKFFFFFFGPGLGWPGPCRAESFFFVPCLAQPVYRTGRAKHDTAEWSARRAWAVLGPARPVAHV